MLDRHEHAKATFLQTDRITKRTLNILVKTSTTLTILTQTLSNIVNDNDNGNNNGNNAVNL